MAAAYLQPQQTTTPFDMASLLNASQSNSVSVTGGKRPRPVEPEFRHTPYSSCSFFSSTPQSPSKLLSPPSSPSSCSSSSSTSSAMSPADAPFSTKPSSEDLNSLAFFAMSQIQDSHSHSHNHNHNHHHNHSHHHHNRVNRLSGGDFGLQKLLSAASDDDVPDSQRKHVSSGKNSHRPPPPPEDDIEEPSSPDSNAARIKWTQELHDCFMKALEILGTEEAIPSKIVKVMNVAGLTRDHVSSHLQKHRLSEKKRAHGIDTPSFEFPPFKKPSPNDTYDTPSQPSSKSALHFIL